jgi:hypothetical protein
MNLLLAILMATGWASTGSEAQNKADTASIRGQIRDAKGAPIADVKVDIYDLGGSSTAAVASVAVTSEGRYEATGLKGGQFRIVASDGRSSDRVFRSSSKIVKLPGGKDLASIDLVMHLAPVITGTVTDENDEPVADVDICLVEREYALGSLRYRFTSFSRTDESGQYRIMANIMPGRAYLVMVRTYIGSVEGNFPAVSQSPTSPKLRKRTFAPTHYPGTDEIQGALPITLRPGELREGVDIRIRRSPSYCLSGTLKGGGGPQRMDFRIAEQQPAGGVGRWPGTVATTGPDGRFRVCDLHAGDYFLTAYVSQSISKTPAFFVRTPISIIDKDVDVTVQAAPQVAVRGEIGWDGDAPPDPLPLRVQLISGTRVFMFGGEVAPENTGNPAWPKVTAPGQFSFDHLYEDEYEVRVTELPADAYVKDVTYNGSSVRYDAFRPGHGQNWLRVVLTRNGGTATVRTVDKDDKPLPDVTVVLLPDTSRSDGALASMMVVARTDQNGEWSSSLLAPGKYYAIATEGPVDKSPESITRLSQMRSKAYELEISPGVVSRAKLTPIAE